MEKQQVKQTFKKASHKPLSDLLKNIKSSQSKDLEMKTTPKKSKPNLKWDEENHLVKIPRKVGRPKRQEVLNYDKLKHIPAISIRKSKKNSNSIFSKSIINKVNPPKKVKQKNNNTVKIIQDEKSKESSSKFNLVININIPNL